MIVVFNRMPKEHKYGQGFMYRNTDNEYTYPNGYVNPGPTNWVDTWDKIPKPYIITKEFISKYGDMVDITELTINALAIETDDDKYIIVGPLKEPSPAPVKEVKYFSEDKYRSKVVMELVGGTSGWVECSFIVKMLTNTLKDKEYEIISTRDLSEFGRLLSLATPDTDDELGISQKFLRILFDKMIEDENFSCEDFFWEQRDLEDGDGYRINVEKEAKVLAEKYFEPIKKDVLNNKIGTIKRATNELSAKFNHFRMFSFYEYKVWLEHCILWYDKEGI